jgi:hypothetical protein
MSGDQSVIRISGARYRGAGYFRQRGSLVLYPDKLAYAGSAVTTMSGAAGLLGALVLPAVATSRATKRIAAGHNAVTTIPLADITNVAAARSKSGKVRAGALIVATTAGAEYKFQGIKADEWSADLSRALHDSGRNTTATDGGFAVS